MAKTAKKAKKKTAAAPAEAGGKKIRVGWFTFTCCEDSTIVMTEIMNDHWQEWKRLFDFRHARVLKTKNVLDAMDVAFVEGAITTESQAEQLKQIRKNATMLVAIGSCACTGMPSGQRNAFSPKQKQEIEFLLARFAQLPKVEKLSDVVKVDAEVPGCPMEPKDFLAIVDAAVARFRGPQPA
ncbi:MAG TPA: hypothetical protein VLC10_00055 [Patescibacteria group bacterium]|nr:hypothetical protein [Patescibacteria group bacterium]